MALTKEEMKEVLECFDALYIKTAELTDDVKALKRKLKKEEKDVEVTGG